MAAVFVETERALGVDEEPYSCTVTIPDDGIVKVSAKNAVTYSTGFGGGPSWMRSPRYAPMSVNITPIPAMMM